MKCNTLFRHVSVSTVAPVKIYLSNSLFKYALEDLTFRYNIITQMFEWKLQIIVVESVHLHYTLHVVFSGEVICSRELHATSLTSFLHKSAPEVKWIWLSRSLSTSS